MSDWTKEWTVLVGGADVSSDLRPLLIEVETTDKAGEAADTASLSLDGDAPMRFPAEGTPVEILFRGVPQFSGLTDAPRISGGRSRQRIVSVSAKSFDVRGKAKEPQQLHADETSLQDFLGRVAGNAGFSLKIDGALAGLQREYWAADGESFLHVGQRLARELNATFKLRGREAVLTPRDQPPALATIVGTTRNTISFDITPRSGRDIWASATATWLDRDATRHQTRKQPFATGRPATADHALRTPVASEADAGQVLDARRGEAERSGGEGTVTLDGEPLAMAEAPFVAVGYGPGIDGLYRIVSRTQRGNRSGGATTDLQIAQPSGSAGTDDREEIS